MIILRTGVIGAGMIASLDCIANRIHLHGAELVERPLSVCRAHGEAGMSVRLGINPITWTNDDVPELGGDTPLETCLAETRLAGYAGTELGGKFPRDSQELRAVLDEHGLALVSGWYDGRMLERDVDAEFDAVLPHLTLLRDLGCRHVVYADTSRRAENDLWGPISRRPRLAEDDWPGYGGKLTVLAERMAAFGVGDGLPPPHGHHRRERRGGGAADAPHRAGGRPALRHGPLPRLPAATPWRWCGGMSAGSSMSTARTPAPRCWRAPGRRI